jgi:predicted porin
VTLYGIADGDLRLDHTNIGTLKSVDSGGESGSRWGIRGSEDLGGGLKANFIFEQGIDITDNSSPQGSIGGGASGGFGGSSTQNHSSTGSRLFGRISQVGLAGPFGEVKFGRGYNPVFLVQATADPFAEDPGRSRGLGCLPVRRVDDQHGGAVGDRPGQARQRPL